MNFFSVLLARQFAMHIIPTQQTVLYLCSATIIPGLTSVLALINMYRVTLSRKLMKFSLSQLKYTYDLWDYVCFDSH